MAEYVAPIYIRCDICNTPLTEIEYFSNFCYCDYCEWDNNNKESVMINPNTKKIICIVGI